MLKSSTDWLADPEFFGTTVLDPDGWDRKNYAASMAEKITKEEFERRLCESTCMWTGPLTAQAPLCL